MNLIGDKQQLVTTVYVSHAPPPNPRAIIISIHFRMMGDNEAYVGTSLAERMPYVRVFLLARYITVMT